MFPKIKFKNKLKIKFKNSKFNKIKFKNKKKKEKLVDCKKDKILNNKDNLLKKILRKK